MCTHVLEIAERICDRIGIMIEGRLLASGTLEELREKAAHDGDSPLEDIFLKLTGSLEYGELLKNL